MSTPSAARIRRYVRARIRTIHSIRDVALHFRTPQETLRKDFRRRTGTPLSVYLLEVRLAAVKRALRRSRRHCFEIIYAAGFAREDSAARTFRARVGMTMETYRRTARRRRGSRP